MVHGDPRLDNFILLHQRRSGYVKDGKDCRDSSSGMNGRSVECGQGDEYIAMAIDLEMAEHEPSTGTTPRTFGPLSTSSRILSCSEALVGRSGRSAVPAHCARPLCPA